MHFDKLLMHASGAIYHVLTQPVFTCIQVNNGNTRTMQVSKLQDFMVTKRRLSTKQAFRKRCLSKFFWSAFSLIRTKYGQTQGISPYSVLMQENTDQENSKYGHFSRSELPRTYSENRFRKRKGSMKLKIGSIISSVIRLCCSKPEELPNSFLTYAFGFITNIYQIYKVVLSC